MISVILEKSDPNHGNAYLGYLRKFPEYNANKISKPAHQKMSLMLYLTLIYQQVLPIDDQLNSFLENSFRSSVDNSYVSLSIMKA